MRDKVASGKLLSVRDQHAAGLHVGFHFHRLILPFKMSRGESTLERDTPCVKCFLSAGDDDSTGFDVGLNFHVWELSFPQHRCVA